MIKIILTIALLSSRAFAAYDDAPHQQGDQTTMEQNFNKTSNFIKGELNNAVNLVDSEYGGGKMPSPPVLKEQPLDPNSVIEPNMKFVDPKAFTMINTPEEQALLNEVLAAIQKNIKIERLFVGTKQGKDKTTKIKPFIKVSSIIVNDEKDWVAFINGKRFNPNLSRDDLIKITRVSNEAISLDVNQNGDVLDRLRLDTHLYETYSNPNGPLFVNKNGNLSLKMEIGTCIFLDDFKITHDCAPRPAKKTKKA